MALGPREPRPAADNPPAAGADRSDCEGGERVGAPGERGRHAEHGVVAIEFALLVPALLLLLLGGIQFGLILRNYLMLTNAVNVGAMQFAISRSASNPASATWTAITDAAPGLTPSTNIEMTLSVGSPLTACLTNANSSSSAEAADSTCATALSNAAPSGGTLQPAEVTATFPCGSQLTWYNFWSSSCKLTSTMTEGVQ